MYKIKCIKCKKKFSTSSGTIVNKGEYKCTSCRKASYKANKKKHKKHKERKKRKKLPSVAKKTKSTGKKRTREYPNLIKKVTRQDGTTKYLSKNQRKDPYTNEVWVITESQPLHLLEGSEDRSWYGKHLDHIVPIAYGKTNNIPPSLIGSLSNLQFIPRKQNLKKKDKLTSRSKKLLKEWGLGN